MSVRAKFKVDKITAMKLYSGQVGKEIFLSPVMDGSEENKQFYMYSPGGSCSLLTVNEAAAAQFELGAEYYLDFTKA